MKKVVDALKAVTWPGEKEITNNFWIVLAGIVLFSIFFTAVDAVITYGLGKLY